MIQSTDKNFLVPVGGAILATGSEDFFKKVTGNYPGRASAAPILDLFITLLSMGKTGFEGLLNQRQSLLPGFQQKMFDFCLQEGLQVLPSPGNTISFAISLQSLAVARVTASQQAISSGDSKDLSFLGSMLFQRNISGCRVVLAGGTKVTRVAGVEFRNWGAHSDSYPESYFTAACAIGMTAKEVDIFLIKLKKTIAKFRKLNIFVNTSAEEAG